MLLFQFPPDIGPELLHHQRNRVVAHLRSPYTGRVLQGAVAGRILRDTLTISTDQSASGMVAVSGNGRRDGGANDFGVVELTVSGVGASYEDPANGISGAVKETSVA